MILYLQKGTKERKQSLLKNNSSKNIFEGSFKGPLKLSSTNTAACVALNWNYNWISSRPINNLHWTGKNKDKAPSSDIYHTLSTIKNLIKTANIACEYVKHCIQIAMKYA